jgi:hypothetical protein
MANNYVLDIQLAGYDYDQYDVKGAVDYDGFLKEFRYFPWAQQLEKRNSIDHGVSATISVKNAAKEFDYWVSVANGERGLIYLIGIVYPKEIERFWGLLKPQRLNWVEVYIAESNVYVEQSAKLYFEGNTSSLKNYLANLELFLSQQSN